MRTDTDWEDDCRLGREPMPVPLAELFGDDAPVECGDCGMVLAKEAILDGPDRVLCSACAAHALKELPREALEYAESEIKVQLPLPDFEPHLQYRCTPEEYEAGNRESYTLKALLCKCRHNRSNYDSIIEELNRFNFTDQIRYLAVRRRVHELILQNLKVILRVGLTREGDQWRAKLIGLDDEVARGSQAEALEAVLSELAPHRMQDTDFSESYDVEQFDDVRTIAIPYLEFAGDTDP